MATVRPIKTNFTNGEVDPLITMRSDLELTANGAAKMRNVLAFPQGGFRRWDGLETMTEIPPAGTLPISLTNISVAAGGSDYVEDEILTFVGGTFAQAAQVRVVEISAGVVVEIEIIAIGDYSVVPSEPTTTSSNLSGTGATMNWEEETQDTVKLIDFNFSIDQNYLIVFTVGRWYVFRKEDTGSGPNQLVDTNTNGVYDNAQLKEITWTQSLDVMIVFHSDVPMRKLVREAETNWTFAEFFPANPPTFAFGLLQTSDLTVTFSAGAVVGDTATLTASPAAFTSAAEDIGKFIRIISASDSDGLNFSSYFEITGFTSTTIVTGKFVVLPIITSSLASYKVGGPNWLLEEVEFSQPHGYPRCGQFYQGRLVTAATKDRPQTMFTSRAGDIDDFNSGTTADDLGIVATASSGTQSIIQNIHAGRHLQLFGDNAEYYVPISEVDPITPTNVALRRTSSVGSMNEVPVFDVDGTVYFVQRGGQSFREFAFVDGVKAYDANIVSLFSSHLIRNPNDAAFKKSLSTEDGNYIWVINEDDFSLAAFSLLKSELINAWTLRTTEGEFRGVAVLDQDSYFHIRRSPGGFIKDSGLFTNLVLTQGPTPDPQGITLSENDDQMIVVDRDQDRAYQYALNIPSSLQRVVYTGLSFDLSPFTTEPKDTFLLQENSKWFVMAQDTDTIIEFDLEDADKLLVTDNVTDSGFALAFEATQPNGTGFGFNADRTHVVISSVTPARIGVWKLNTAGTFEDGAALVGSLLDISSIDDDPQDVKFGDTDSKLTVAGSENDSIYHFVMSTALDASTAALRSTFSVTDLDTEIRALTYSSSGKQLFFCGTQNDTIIQLNLSNSTEFGEQSDWIEFFQADLKFDAGICQVSGITTPITEITGQAQLANESVGIIIDDVIYENQTVDESGDMTFPIEAHYNYQVGLAFPNIIVTDENNEDVDTGFNVLVQTLPADVLLGSGTTMGKKKRIPRCTVRFVETQGFYLQGKLVPFRNLPQVLDRPIPLQTGEKELTGLLGYDNFGQITIAQREPLAMTVLGLGYDLSTGT